MPAGIPEKIESLQSPVQLILLQSKFVNNSIPFNMPKKVIK